MTENQVYKEKIRFYTDNLKGLQNLKDYQSFLEYSKELIVIYSEIGYSCFHDNNYADCLSYITASNNLINELDFYRKEIFGYYEIKNNLDSYDLIIKEINFINQKNKSYYDFSDANYNMILGNYDSAITSFDSSNKLFNTLYELTNEPTFLIYSKSSKAQKFFAEGYQSAYNQSSINSITHYENGIIEYENIINELLPQLLNDGKIPEDLFEFYKITLGFSIKGIKIDSLTSQASMHLSKKSFNLVIEKYNEIVTISDELLLTIPPDMPKNNKIKLEADNFLHKAYLYLYLAIQERTNQNWLEAIRNYELCISNFESASKSYIKSQHPSAKSIQELIYNKLPFLETEKDECETNQRNLEISNKTESENFELKRQNKNLKDYLTNDYKRQKIKKWKLFGKIYFTVSCILSIMLILFLLNVFSEFNPIYYYSVYVDKMPNGLLKILRNWVPIGVITIIVIPCIAIWYRRHFNQNNINQKENSISLPVHLKKLANDSKSN